MKWLAISFVLLGTVVSCRIYRKTPKLVPVAEKRSMMRAAAPRSARFVIDGEPLTEGQLNRIVFPCTGIADVAAPFNVVDLDDLLAVLNAFSAPEPPCPWTTPSPGPCISCMVDICNCRADGEHVIDLDDILAVLKAYSEGITGYSTELCPKRRWACTKDGPRYQRMALFLGDQELAINEDGKYEVLVGEEVTHKVVSQAEPW